MANIRFDYLYRGAGNNKQHGYAVFANAGGIPHKALDRLTIEEV